MLGNALTELFVAQRSRPLSVAVAAMALFVPGYLIIFLSKPSLFETVGLNGVLILSVAISLPILLLCFGLWYSPLSSVLKAQQLLQGQPQETDLETIVRNDDPLEWPCLLAGGWTANLLLFGTAAYAYFRPLRIGATFLLLAAILLGIWFLAFAASAAFYLLVEHKWKGRSAEIAQR